MHRRPFALAATAGLAAALVVPLAPPAQAQDVAQTGIVSDNPSGFTPNVMDGKVEAFARVGNTIVAGGSFSQVQASGGGTTYTRNNIVAFDATTGAISTSFAPSVSGEVYDIEPAGDGTSVYVSGQFTQVNGTSSSRVARLDVATGAKVNGFAVGSINGPVKNVDLVDGRLLIGGSFGTVGGTTRTAMASLDPSSGALTAFLDISVTGTNNGGGTQVLKMAVSPDGSRLVAIGNFTAMNGQERLQIAMVDLTGGSATLANWATGMYTNSCASVFDTYLRDLDFSPDGTYFVVSTTGAYRGSDSPCDVITRWETSATGSDLEPTWKDYTGGDTTYAVAVTGAAVYIGGHFRWLNNPEAGDAAGPGAVPREGIAALDPVSGLPLSWNPGRARGVGVFDMLATDTGLWVGSDTDRIGGETHRKIAFFPLAGGTSLPTQKLGQLPDDVYQLGQTATDTDVLYRVNAGGPTLGSADDGPDWMSDAAAAAAGYKSGSSTSADWVSPGPVNGSVPHVDTDRAPAALFATESWGPAAGPDEMGWHFPVTSGEAVTVRLYLANRCSCTANVGERVFDVSIDGSVVLEDWDLVARYGDQVGAMEDFDIISDGSVDIDVTHVVENPLINGIEIVRSGTQPNPADTNLDVAQKRSFDGVVAGPASPVGGAVAWGDSRGAFLVDDTLYAAFADGTFTRRAFDPSATNPFGPATAVNLYGGSFGSQLSSVTGLTYADGRIYYTVSGDDTMHWRWFSPQSNVVGETQFDVDGANAALDPTRVSGMFVSGSDLYAADRTSGDLVHMQLSGTTLSGPVATVSSDVDWDARSLFLGNSGATPVNQAPTAQASASCPAVGLTCDFSSLGSDDPDGTISSYAWSFSDGGSSTQANPSHAFAAGGTYTATLTVTDNDGAPSGAASTGPFTVTAPPPDAPVAAFSSSCSGLSCTFTNTSTGPVTSQSWTFGDGGTSTEVSPAHSYGSAATYTVELTVNGPGGSDTESAQVTVSETASSVEFRDAATANGNRTSYPVPAVTDAQSGDVLLLFATSARGSQPTATPTGWTLVGTQADGSSMRTTVYRRLRGTGDLGTVTWPQRTKANLTVLAYSGAGATPTASVAAAKTTSSSATFTAPAATVDVTGSAVVSFWAIRSSAAATWTVAPGTTERADSAGSGRGQVGAAAADQLGVAAGVVAARNASASLSSSQGVGWTVVLAPAP